MTDEREDAPPDAGSMGRLRGSLEERARRADERDRAADQRDVIAREREQLADERDRIADVREWQLSQALAPRPANAQRRRRETLKRARQANARDGARIDRLEAGLVREDADRHRQAAEREYETTRADLEELIAE